MLPNRVYNTIYNRVLYTLFGNIVITLNNPLFKNFIEKRYNCKIKSIFPFTKQYTICIKTIKNNRYIIYEINKFFIFIKFINQLNFKQLILYIMGKCKDKVIHNIICQFPFIKTINFNFKNFNEGKI